MIILAIDPGTEKSGYVIIESKNLKVLEAGVIGNHDLIYMIKTIGREVEVLAIEMIASYGMAVGQSTFETCVWIGRFIQEFDANLSHFVYRKDVKIYLCNSMKAKDANIRQAIIDKYPASGGGKIPQIGTKKQPGPLYGVSSHAWSALAVGITFLESTIMLEEV